MNKNKLIPWDKLGEPCELYFELIGRIINKHNLGFWPKAKLKIKSIIWKIRT